MIHLNEKNLGDRVTRCEINAVISYLQGRGYSVTYGPHCPDAAKAIKPAHWRAAIKAAHRAAAQAEQQMRDFYALPLAEQREVLEGICDYLSDLLCEKLFAENMPLQPMPAPVEDRFLAEVMAEVAEVLG